MNRLSEMQKIATFSELISDVKNRFDFFQKYFLRD